jgi:hypothetical protein
MSNDGLRTLDEAEEQIERLNSRVVELMREVERLQEAKRRALHIADERAIEAVGLRSKLESARKALLIAQDVVWFDWSGNDDDAVHAMEQLRLELSALTDDLRGK